MLSPIMITNSNGNFARAAVSFFADLDLDAVAGAGVADDGELHRVGLVRQRDVLRRRHADRAEQQRQAITNRNLSANA